jgi:hypothetical protein
LESTDLAADIAFVVAVVLDIADDITSIYISKDWNKEGQVDQRCVQLSGEKRKTIEIQRQ